MELPPSSTLLMDYELVRTPEEDLGGTVLPKFTAQGTRDRDGLKRKFLPA